MELSLRGGGMKIDFDVLNKVNNMFSELSIADRYRILENVIGKKLEPNLTARELRRICFTLLYGGKGEDLKDRIEQAHRFRATLN